MNKKGSDEATSLGTALSFTDSMELNTFSHDTSLLDSTLDANITLDENNSNDNLTNDTSGEIISKHEESCPKISTPMTIRFAEGQTVFLVKMRSRAPDHKKMDYRHISNPWRRFGSLKTIYAMGGHVPPKKKAQRFIHVKPGTVLSNEPKSCQLSLHRDAAVLNQEFFKFKLNRSSDSQTIAHSVGLQIAENCQAILRSKHLPSKSIRKPVRQQH